MEAKYFGLKTTKHLFIQQIFIIQLFDAKDRLGIEDATDQRPDTLAYSLGLMREKDTPPDNRI